MTHTIKTKKLGFLLIAIMACVFFAPFINTMYKKKVATKPRYKTELSVEEEEEFQKLFNEDKEEECIKFIEKHNLDPDYKLNKSFIINKGTHSGFLDLLKYLIKKGANVNIQSKSFVTYSPLHAATFTANYQEQMKEEDDKNIKKISLDKCLEIIKTLVDNGANIYTKNEFGKQPIDNMDSKEESPIYSYLYSLYPYKEKYTTHYSDEKKENTLDIGIILEWNYPALKDFSKSNTFASMDILSKFIENKEAVIVSSIVLKILIDAADGKYAYLKPKSVIKAEKNINDIFYSDNWLIFITNDREFVLLIPHSKYPTIKNIEDISQIGLNSANLFTFANESKGLDERKAKRKELYDELTKQKERIEIDVNTLANLFLPRDIVDIRVYLFGHGKNISKLTDIVFWPTYIAQLSIWQYRDLRDALDKAGCSFLYVDSCYSGSNVYKAQTINIKAMAKNEKYLGLSTKYFIEIASSIPGAISNAIIEDINFRFFFHAINSFFMEEKNNTVKLINSDKKLTREEKNHLVKNLTEQQVLSGRLELPKKQVTNHIYYINPIISREKDIKKSREFLKIFKHSITLKIKTNLPRVRFPGDSEMLPLKEVFPDLVPKIKKKLKKILVERNKELTEFKEYLPTLEKKLNEAKDVNPEHLSLVKDEIKLIEIEVKDIENYMKQLDQN